MDIDIKCLDEKALSSYLDEKLSETERKKIEEHIADCNTCLDMLLVAYESQGRSKKCPLWLKRKVGDGFKPPPTTSKIKKKRSELKWLFAGIFFFALSFIFRDYFLQFLAVSVILGFKWVMEGEAAKRVIMIFKGIQEKEKKFERKSPPDVSSIVGEGFKPSPTKHEGGDRYGKPE